MHLSSRSALLRLVLLPVVLALGVTGIAVLASPAASARLAASATPAGHAASARPAVPTLAGPSLISPVPGRVPASPAQAATASDTCAQYAARAGWLNNGYYGGDLVTAVAICVAESTGDPKLYVCDDNGTVVGQGDFGPGHPVKCPPSTTSYDRGLWQLNSVNASSITNNCAFSPVCNAAQAYLYSGRGTNFSLWSSYGQDVYPPFIDPAQAAVTALTIGAVTSAELGECLAQAKSAPNAKVVIANCGGGTTIQRWTVTGSKLRSGSVCAATQSSAAGPGVVLRKCAPSKAQDWVTYGRDELRNVADGKCLTDPSGSLAAGTQVTVTACASAKDQTWWLP